MMKHRKESIILAIDTSCDDTAIAVVKVRNLEAEILSNVVSSQVKLHQQYGGVYPTLAKREHQKNLTLVLKKSLRQAKFLNSKCKIKKEEFQSKIKNLEKILARELVLKEQLFCFLRTYQKPNLNAIAVTVGPGLEPCLWAGVNFAKALAYFWDLPIIPVNHIEAHLLINFLTPIDKNFQKILPAIGLVASGGHTELILIKNIGQYKVIGKTRDDAAGECFDKTARILGLDYPGGPAIARLAEQWKSQIPNPKSQTNFNNQISKFKIKLPRPMLNSKDYDFSFSGLKTAVLYDYKKRSKKIRESEEYKIKMAKEIQQSIIDVLILKTIKAAKDYGVKSIILGGGVVANTELRYQLKQKIKTEKSGLKFQVPSSKFCADNAAMVGITASFHLRSRKVWRQIKARANLSLF